MEELVGLIAEKSLIREQSDDRRSRQCSSGNVALVAYLSLQNLAPDLFSMDDGEPNNMGLLTFTA